MSEILFGQSYYLRFDPKLWKALQPYPPLGTLYAASYLRNRGYEVALFDAMLAASEAEWAEALDREQPRFAVIYEDNFNYLSKMCLLRMRQAAFKMITMARQRGCTVILAGADASDHAAQYLSQGAHFVLLGEGEHTLAELLDRLTGHVNTPFEQILGLAYLDENEGTSLNAAARNVVATPRRPDIRDLDLLPFPAWDLVNIPRYREIWVSHHGYYSMNMVTTRGCPFHCNWCAKPIWGQHYNTRSPENVFAEIQWLHETFQPDHIWFMDDIFGLKPGWVPHFADLIAAGGLRLPFKCLNRVDLLLRKGEIESLKQAGCQIVWVGAESGSQKILDAMDKGTRVEQIYTASRRLKDAGIQVGFFLQFGYPGENLTDIQQTLQMVRDCSPDDIGMSVSYPLPGTPFYQAVQNELGLQQNWYDSSDLAMLYQGPFDTTFYRQLHTVVHREFRARKAWARLPKFSALLSLVKNLLLLPWERWKLNRLSRLPHRGLGPILPILTPEAAAQPSRQEE